MAKPVVAVVGRPNVGKSTLFNKLIGQRLSIVEDTPGVTRDRIYAECEWLGHTFMLVDTGGIEPQSDDVILLQMRRQAEVASERASVIILVVDVRDGVTATDQDVAQMLLKSGKPVILCVNKCDGIGDVPPEFYEFYNLGLGDPIAVCVLEFASRKTARSAMSNMLASSCETMTIVAPKESRICTINSSNLCDETGSKPALGSSKNNTDGSKAIARASPARLAIPPLISDG